MTKPVVYIVVYSLYQHIYKLSLAIKEGLEEKGIQVELYQVAETLSDEILTKMQAPAKPDLPIMTVDKLSEPDGILFGLPTRFGMFPAQIKTLLDASGALWAKGALAGKFAGTFFSTASQHGGQETTALTAVTYFAHHGMMYVPFGFAHPGLNNNDEVVGGSAYGAGTISDGDGSRQPSSLELDIAKNQGQNFGVIVGTFVKGKGAILPENTTSAANAVGTSNKVDTSVGNAVPTNAASGVPSEPAGNAATGAATGAVATGAAATAVAAGTAATGSAASGPTTASANRGVVDPNGTAPPAPAHSDNVAAQDALGNAAPTNALAGTPATPAGNEKTSSTSKGATAAAATGAATGTTTGATGATGESAAAANKPSNAINDNAHAAKTTAADAKTAATTAKTNATGAVDGSSAAATKTGATAGATAATAAGTASAVPNKPKDNKPKKKKWFCCG